MEFLYWTTLVLFLFVCIILILLVLIQKGRGGGLAGAFGGAGGNTAFGSKTGDVLTWATSILFGVFLLLAVATNWMSNSINGTRYPQANAAAAPAGPTPLSRPPGMPSLPGASGEPTGGAEEPASPTPTIPGPSPAGGASAAPGGGIAPPAAPAPAPAAPTSQPAR